MRRYTMRVTHENKLCEHFDVEAWSDEQALRFAARWYPNSQARVLYRTRRKSA